jgi:hypothetical protein
MSKTKNIALILDKNVPNKFKKIKKKLKNYNLLFLLFMLMKKINLLKVNYYLKNYYLKILIDLI